MGNSNSPPPSPQAPPAKELESPNIEQIAQGMVAIGSDVEKLQNSVKEIAESLKNVVAKVAPNSWPTALVRRLPRLLAICVVAGFLCFWLFGHFGRTITNLDTITAEHGRSLEGRDKPLVTQSTTNELWERSDGSHESETSHSRVANNGLRLLFFTAPLGLAIWGLVKLGRED
jgi:hypothetical protein